MDSNFRGQMRVVMFKELDKHQLKRPSRPELEAVVNAVVEAIALAIDDSDRRVMASVQSYVNRRFGDHGRMDHGWR